MFLKKHKWLGIYIYLIEMQYARENTVQKTG